MDNQDNSTREFDIIVWGASSYMGQLITEHLFLTYGVNRDLRWAMGGRNADKLASVRDRIGSGAEQIPIIIAESHDRTLLDAMAKRTRVICSSVGPYQFYGEELVVSCIENGTDYCDLTGEFLWIREMIDKYGAKAREQNVRLVNSCGFDSLPSDLGTLFVQNEFKKRYGEFSPEVRMRVKHGFMDVKPSGGTIASILGSFERVANDKQLMKLAYDPNGLLPNDAVKITKDMDVKYPKYEQEIKSWVAPYLMAAGNTKIVRRGNALMEYRYGRDFLYGEGICSGTGIRGWWRATKATLSLYTMIIMMAIGFTRDRLRRKLPKPGEGMSKAERESRTYSLVFTAQHPENAHNNVRAEINGKRDMGYGSSSRMIGEAAVCLALDESSRSVPGGFWTPASCLGERLIERLQRNAEIQFTVR